MKKLCWLLKCAFGFGTVADGSLCWFSKKFFDLHDYGLHSGGDGYPSHFHEYECSGCGRKFTI